MKAVLLAGGLGTRLSEETNSRPKPMVEIGSKPILWHIMKMYSFHGINDFIICCGYKGYMIKEYFANYFLHQSDVTFSLEDNKMNVHERRVEPWNVTLVDTGLNSMTGGRLGRVKEYIKDEESFCFTYGDGVGDIDIFSLVNFHKQHGKQATVTATYPPGRFGALNITDGLVGQYDGGPGPNAKFTYDYNTLFFATDPFALDMICHQLMVKKRKKMNVKVNEHPMYTEYLRYAERLGLGVADLEKIEHITIA